MTAPQPDQTGQILVKLGEMGAQLAVIVEQLKAVPDHEARLRALEQWRWKVTGVAIAAGVISGVLSTLLSHVSIR